MSSGFPRIVYGATLSVLALAGTTSAAPGDTQASLDVPCKYPAGLAADGDRLYVADWRDAKIFELSTSDGRTLRSWNAPTLKPHGLTFAQGRLIISDDHTGTIQAMKLDTGIVETTFQAPQKRATGLAFNNGTLFILARDKIYRVLPGDGTILDYFDAPDPGCRCMTHDGRYLWVGNRTKDEIYMVDPETGKVIAVMDAPGPYPAGIAHADHHLWNVDFQTRKLYKLAIRDKPMYRLKETRRARVEYLWALNNYGPASVSDLRLNLALPMTLPNQRLLSDVNFSRRPTKFARDRWDQSCALFNLGTVPAGSKETLTYDVNAEVSAIRYLIIPEQTGTLADIPADIREAYTVDGTRYRLQSPYIQETAKKIVGDESNPYWIARKIYDFIIGSLEYEMIGGWDIPEVVLKRGSGSCSEYTYTFVALCRAAGLPARYQGSIVVRGDDASIDEAFHRWAQVYLPTYGWVPVDANRGDKESPVDQAKGFGELANRFLITTQGGGDSEFMDWGYNSYVKYKTNGYCKIEEDVFGFWEPLDAADASPSVAEGEADGCQPSGR